MLRKSTLLILFLCAWACGTKQPKVVDESQKKPKTTLAHTSLKTGCTDCHEAERPEPYKDIVSVTHGEGAACESCHTWPVYKTINTAVKAHNPYPKQCLGCHSVELERASHAAQGDCKACHRWPAWLPTVIGG